MISTLVMLATLGSNVTHATSPVAPSEVRGTWLTTTANEAISSPANTSVTMKRLREIGLNTVYVEIWKNGYTEFPSNTAKKFTNSELRINSSPSGAIQRDLLQETLIEAHRNGLIYIAWFEYG
ncbi:MAG: family 10 glycosylhydrolase, partial [Armatimonadota bacterium]